MPLTATEVKSAKPRDKPYKVFDSGGLSLQVVPTGGKRWRLKYRFAGKEKGLSLGVYPEVSLRKARDRRDAYRKLLADGVDPGEVRKAEKAAKTEGAANSFEVIAREWLAKHSPNWSSGHSTKVIAQFENHVFPWIGDKPISGITAQQLLVVLRRIEEGGAVETGA